jgi:hypothetical protein
MTVELTTETIRSGPLNKVLRVNNQDLLQVVGRSLISYMRGWMQQLDRSHANRMGWPHSHFYSQFGNSLFMRIGNSEIVIGGNKPGFLLHYYGGDIQPVNGGKYLTIPATGEAYVHAAREFQNLVPLIRRVGGVARAVALVESDSGSATHTSDGTPVRARRGITKNDRNRGVKGVRRDKDDEGRRIFYWLVLQAHIDADRSIFPTTIELQEVVRQGANNFLETLLAA